MKQIMIVVFLFGCVFQSTAQLGNILKRKAGEGVKQGTQNATEKVIDKTLAGKPKKKDGTEETSAKSESVSLAAGSPEDPQPSVKMYSKYDFIAGEKILAYDEFASDQVGDFPARWTTNASGELMMVDGHAGKWLNVSKEGYYIPAFIKTLPENFTMEYDILFIPPAKRDGPNTAAAGMQFIYNTTAKPNFQYGPGRSYFQLDPYLGNVQIGSFSATGERILENQFSVKGLDRNKTFSYHVAVWRQKTRLRVYFNETKVVDAPSLLENDIPYNNIRFSASLNNDGSTWLISNFKLATGLPDTRNKLLNEGKFSTTGILFAVNSSAIRPNSYATLKEIATVLKENTSLKIMIMGHTDSDGDAGANLELSQKRAEAVKAMLVKEFGIDESLIQTGGKGETQPLVPNTSAEGKLLNRRVEFIKL
jgi:OmpA-OmpF porin, OOP family